MKQQATASSPPIAPVSFRHRFNVLRSLVYSAWTSPELIKHWLHPSEEWSNPVVEVDLRVGGNYRFGFQHPDQSEVVFVVGEFREVGRGERLVYTWSWLPPDPHSGVETLVTVEFADDGDGTVVNLRHDRFPTDEVRDRHSEGWDGTMVCLTNYLASR